MSIETVEDWWQLVDREWDSLIRLVLADVNQHGKPVCRPVAVNLPIEHPEGELTGQSRDEVLAELVKAKQDRDHETLLLLFNRAWAAAPDDISIHRRPGWDALCDLCSEDWVFEGCSTY